MLPSLLQISPVSGGIIAGVLHTILGPDHLCTIVTLSACQGAEAFWFGVRWAGGHLAGMAVLGISVTLLHAANVTNLNFEAYEHYMYYVVGCMLMFMGAYFIFYADFYFDDEWAPKQASCACHAHSAEPIKPSQSDDPGYGCRDTEAQPVSLHADKFHGIMPATGLRETGSMLVGFFQGIACPAGVVGIVFLKQYSPMEMCVFISVFFIVTSLSMGLVAMTYGMLTRSCVSSKVLGRSIYYFSCGLSLVLGATWIALNATHRLDAILGHDHSHGAHDHNHSVHDHSHGEHDHQHGHNHNHMMMQEEVRLSNLFLLTR